MHLDQKQPGYDAQTLPRYLESIGMPYTVLEQDTYSVVKRVVPEGRTMCSLCSRLRRGNLYDHAATQGYTKIALGHHRDDIVETLFLNLFYQAKLKAMPPKLRSDDGRNVVIRPLAYCREDDIADYAQRQNFPIMPCNLCGSQENLQRKAIKAMLFDWERQFPGSRRKRFSCDWRCSAVAACRSRPVRLRFALGSRSTDPHVSASDWLRGEPADASN